MLVRFRLTLPICCLIAVLSTAASADWTLENAGSRVSFVTVKAEHIAEVHTFDELSGTVAADGNARVVIQLASVNTLIPIRDERMRETLFQTDVLPTADVTAKLDLDSLEALAIGSSTTVTTEMMLTLGDVQLPLTAALLVTRSGSDRMLVVSPKAIIINAATVSLAEGVEQLRQIAGLPSISQAVPVMFVLQFNRNDS